MNCIPSVNYAAFSKLAPHSRLASHRHSSPTSLIMHMGLQVPDGCGISVDVDEHDWQQPGDMIIFDDNQEHSAWNDSDEDRILLYVDFERGIDD
jgi:aspartyl/asparaginyl beta-hydroxylase (cupin superfamily)